MSFRKPSRCGSSACVEVDLSHAYRKSSRCGAGSCHSKDPAVDLRFTPAEWDAFVAGVKAGEFDVPEHQE
jgi:hypothetical protein